MPRRLLFCLVVLLCLLGQVAAQEVVYEGGMPSYQSSAIRREVEQNGPSWFPIPSATNPTGSLIEIDGDYYNSDVLLVFLKSFLPRMVPRAAALARQIGRPLTVLRVTQGQVIGCIDMEFNRYVKFDGNSPLTRSRLGQSSTPSRTGAYRNPSGS